MSDKFLFIEIRDKEISSLLNSLRGMFSNRKYNTGIHITIKGPQKTFRKISINKFLEENNPIQIHDVGMFSNEGVYIVYIKVNCDSLKGHIWRKLYYKGEYNPHITLYKGQDEDLAKAVLHFLEEENISLVCKKYDVVTHTQNQPDLFSKPPKLEKSDLHNLESRGCIRGGLLVRATKMFADTREPLTI